MFGGNYERFWGAGRPPSVPLWEAPLTTVSVRCNEMNSICSGRSKILSGYQRFIKMRIPPNATPATPPSPAKIPQRTTMLRIRMYRSRACALSVGWFQLTLASQLTLPSRDFASPSETGPVAIATMGPVLLSKNEPELSTLDTPDCGWLI